MSSRLLAYAALAAGGLLGLVASAQPWWRAGSGDAGVGFPGTLATGGLSQALALVTAAGLLLGLSLRGRGRGVLALLLAVVGSAMVVLGLSRPRPGEAEIRGRLRRTSLTDDFDLAGSVWPYLYAVAGVVVLLGSVVMLLRASRWPQRSDRFQRRAGSPGAVDPADATAVWRALDAGVDPTLTRWPTTDSPSSGGAEPDGEDHPDVRPQGRNDTMGHIHAPTETRDTE